MKVKQKSLSYGNACNPNFLDYLIPILPGKASRRARGGDMRFDRVLPDIVRTFKSDRKFYCTTMLDFYGSRAFPEAANPVGNAPQARVARLETAFDEWSPLIRDDACSTEPVFKG